MTKKFSTKRVIRPDLAENLHVHSVNVEAFTQRRRFSASTPSRVTISGLGSLSICKFLKVYVSCTCVLIGLTADPGTVFPHVPNSCHPRVLRAGFPGSESGYERGVDRLGEGCHIVFAIGGKNTPSGAGGNERFRVARRRTIASSGTVW